MKELYHVCFFNNNNIVYESFVNAYSTDEAIDTADFILSINDPGLAFDNIKAENAITDSRIEF